MTKERMGEIALTFIKVAFMEFDGDEEVNDEEIETLSKDTGISKEELKEFFSTVKN